MKNKFYTFFVFFVTSVMSPTIFAQEEVSWMQISQDASLQDEQIKNQENFTKLQNLWERQGLPRSILSTLKKITVLEGHGSASSCQASIDPYSLVIQLPKNYLDRCGENQKALQLFFQAYAYSYPEKIMDNPGFLGLYTGSASVLSSIEKKEEFVEKMADIFLKWFFKSEKTCSYPWAYRQFDQLFFPKARACDQAFYLPVNDGLTIQFQKIDPSSVARVDYVIAGSGSELVSAWGHSMFRWIICPKSQDLAECATSSTNHLMLQFGGMVNENSMNPLRGVFGGYRAEFNIMPAESKASEYTMSENRRVDYYPLKLSIRQTQDFLALIRELMVVPEESYLFFVKNCATQSLLATSILFQKNIFLMNITTPGTLLSFYRRQGLVQNNVEAQNILNNENDRLEKLFRNHFYTPSYEPGFQDVLASKGIYISPTDSADHSARLATKEKLLADLLSVYKSQGKTLSKDQLEAMNLQLSKALTEEVVYQQRLQALARQQRLQFFEQQGKELTKNYMDEYILTKQKVKQITSNPNLSEEEKNTQIKAIVDAFSAQSVAEDAEYEKIFQDKFPEFRKAKDRMDQLQKRLAWLAFSIRQNLK